MDAPFPDEDPNDLRHKRLQLDETGLVVSSTTTVFKNEDGSLKQIEVGVLDGNFIYMSPRFNEDFKRWNGAGWEDVERPVTFTAEDIAAAIKSRDQTTLDIFVSQYELD